MISKKLKFKIKKMNLILFLVNKKKIILFLKQMKNKIHLKLMKVTNPPKIFKIKYRH